LPTGEGREWIRISPSQERERLPAGEPFLELPEAGFYELRPAGESGAAALEAIAVNVDPAESDLASADPEEVASSLGRAPRGETATGEPLTAEERERRQGIWWFALLLAGAVLAGETILSNNLSRAVK